VSWSSSRVAVGDSLAPERKAPERPIPRRTPPPRPLADKSLAEDRSRRIDRRWWRALDLKVDRRREEVDGARCRRRGRGGRHAPPSSARR
jgi:hypothetical protein